MSTLLSSIIAIIALLMFFLRREQKMVLLWFSLMCLVAFPQLALVGTVLNIPTCFLLSEIRKMNRLWRKTVPIWLTIIFFLMIIATIILFFTSPHYSGIKGIIVMTEEEFIRNYLFIIYALISVSGFQSMKSLLNCTFYSILLLTFWGLIEFVSGHPVFLEFIYHDRNVTAAMERLLSMNSSNTERYRVHSMLPFAFDYGYICSLSLLLALYTLNKGFFSSKKCWIIIICSLFGIMVCACRTVYICAGVALLIYLQAYNFNRRMITIIGVIVLFIFAYFLIPDFQRIIFLMLSVFDTNSTVSGSSLEMRQAQFASVLYYVKDNILFGMGKRFFILDMGYLEGGRATVDSSLEGLEGVVMNLLLERGIFGLVLYAIFYITLLLKAYAGRKVDKVTSTCCLSVIVSYIIFASMTGELNSVPPTLFIVGAFFKMIQVNVKQRAISRM